MANKSNPTILLLLRCSVIITPVLKSNIFKCAWAIPVLLRNANLHYDSWNPSLRGAQRRGNPVNSPLSYGNSLDCHVAALLAMTTFMFYAKFRIHNLTSYFEVR